MKLQLMRHELKLWCAGIAVSWLLAGASVVNAYTYRVGPNYVYMSATRCRAATAANSSNLSYSPAKVTVVNTSSTMQLFCPIQRRNTTFYGDLSGTNIDWKVGGDAISVGASDQSTVQSLSCFAFAAAIGTGATFFSPTRYLCSTKGGCTSVSSSFRGKNIVTLSTPYGSTGTLTVNWGVACNVPQNSTLYYVDSSIWPNETF